MSDLGDSQWKPLSAREGRRDDSGPFEGVPEHLLVPLVNWYSKFIAANQGVVRAPERVRMIALRLRIPAPKDATAAVAQTAKDDPEGFLDVIDLGLHMVDVITAAQTLERYLEAGGSVWAVAADRRSLIRRVSDAENRAYQQATNPTDDASAEVSEAWTNVYGRNPNPSDAWDHAIKACEHILKPIVTPNDRSATLGGVVGQLRANPPVFDLVLRDNGQRNVIEPLDAFEKMLHLIWVNPDRHGGSPDERKPTQQEAQAVVQLAILVVQWARTGVLVKKRT
jgi:hypothetical protein